MRFVLFHVELKKCSKPKPWRRGTDAQKTEVNAMFLDKPPFPLLPSNILPRAADNIDCHPLAHLQVSRAVQHSFHETKIDWTAKNTPLSTHLHDTWPPAPTPLSTTQLRQDGPSAFSKIINGFENGTHTRPGCTRVCSTSWTNLTPGRFEPGSLPDFGEGGWCWPV